MWRKAKTRAEKAARATGKYRPVSWPWDYRGQSCTSKRPCSSILPQAEPDSSAPARKCEEDCRNMMIVTLCDALVSKIVSYLTFSFSL